MFIERGNTMIIEFYGLPGSGKTTIAKAMSNKYSYYQLCLVSSIVEIIYFSLLFILSRPRQTISLLTKITLECLNSKSLSLHFKFFLRICELIATMARYQKAYLCSRKGKIGLLDDGFFQRILLPFECSTEDEVIELLKCIPKPDVLIILDASRDIRFERMKRRGWFPREELGREYCMSLLKYIEKQDRIIRNALKGSLIKVISISNVNRNLEELITEIDNKIVKYKFKRC